LSQWLTCERLTVLNPVMEKVKYGRDNFMRFYRNLIIHSKLNKQSVDSKKTFHSLVCRIPVQQPVIRGQGRNPATCSFFAV
jgi:hypothetical protein